ncbi:MAG: Rpn family recombination-promoting nuclease/putative transposase [Proteobacteria bacterium]|nr:Rpn family recombination-promoting nuclease/putative transposase [Pseudomonadota bacterium]
MSKKAKKITHGYDHALKLLFSHPIMIESLIKGFVPEAWTKQLDFSSLQKVSVKHVTDDLRTRESDIIWKIDFKKKSLYIICLLEFQSAIDKFMAVRVLTYIGLIYQDLIRHEHIEKVDELPPVFSLVLYTGSKIWDAPTKLKDCFSYAIPESLRKYQPNIEYAILDIGQIDLGEYNFEEDNIVSSLVELENVCNLTNTKVIIDKLISQLQGEQFNSLRKAFVVYINRVWKPRRRFARKEFIDLNEVSLMLSERIDQWEREKIQEGMQQGMQQGILTGTYNERLSLSLKLLAHKFPTAPLAFKERLQNMPYDALGVLLEKIIKATEIEELVED